MESVNQIFKLALFAFSILPLWQKQACGPEGRALRAKSIGGKGIPPGDPPGLPQAGPSGARPAAPTRQYLSSWEKNGLPARPRKRRRAWFWRATPFLPGLAIPEIRGILGQIGEKRKEGSRYSKISGQVIFPRRGWLGFL